MTNDSHNKMEKVNFARLPVGKEEDVEFSEELADEADRQAQQRARQADERAQGHQDGEA